MRKGNREGRLDCRQLSRRFQVRALSEEDVPLVYALCRGNRLFYQYGGTACTAEDIRRDLTLTPPGKSLSEKYYIGFFDGARLTAVMDLIDGYPDGETAYIGFFMMDTDCQGKGVGTSIVSEVCACLGQWGFQRVQLGIDKENPQSMHFWKKNGFTAIREVSHERGTMVVARRSL